MKTRIISALLLSAMLLFSLSFMGCTEKNATDDVKKPKDEYRSVYGYVDADEVLTVSSSMKTETAVSYKLVLASKEKERIINVTAPSDYTDKKYPVVLYFPGNGIPTPENDAELFGDEGVICFTFISGITDADLWEGDLFEIGEVLSLLKKSRFAKDSKIFAIGSGLGSIKAFLSAANFPDEISGVAALDAICDLSVYYGVGQGSELTCEAICGGSPEEMPEEYAKRSPVSFAEKIKCPIVIFSSVQQAEVLCESVKSYSEKINSTGGHCVVEAINEDFVSYFTPKVKDLLLKFIKE